MPLEQMSLLDEPAPSTVVFDLETRESFDDVGGFANIPKMRVSVGVLYQVEHDQYFDFTEETIGDLIDMLFSATRVIGFNILGFDYKVLLKYTTRSLHHLPSLDLLDTLYRHLGFRVSLDKVASTTLGMTKSADGLQAIRWWQTGQIDKIREYCRQDVKVTYEVYAFGKKNGYVWIPTKHGKDKVPVTWT